MPTQETISMYAMYVIGEVESGHRWNAVNYNDPITIGMMQWYGQRAAGLIERCAEQDPAGYQTFTASAPRVVAAVEADHSWDWWTGFYLTTAEGAAWQTWAEADAVHVAQQLQWLDDFEGYWEDLTGKGMPEANVKQIIYAMAMRHQAPLYCNQVLGTCSVTATLANMHATCLNHSVLGQYVNRYTTVYNLLNAWDGESDPPDFGQLTDIIIGGNPSNAVSRPTSPVSRVEIRNGNIVIWGMEDYPSGLYCVPAGPLTWIPSSGFSGVDDSGNEQTEQGDEEGDEGRAGVAALYRSWENLFDYSQNTTTRLDPVTTGEGDCSSTIWRAYKDVTGVDVGTWTGAMRNKGELVAEGDSSDSLPIDSMLPADLVLIDWPENGYNETFDHVEMYMGNNELWGHGGGSYGTEKGPNLTTSNADTYTQYFSRWQVRRYL